MRNDDDYKTLSEATATLSVAAGLIPDTIDSELAWRMWEMTDAIQDVLIKSGMSRTLAFELRLRNTHFQTAATDPNGLQAM